LARSFVYEHSAEHANDSSNASGEHGAIKVGSGGATKLFDGQYDQQSRYRSQYAVCEARNPTF
jgi:hypothetical protein